jgi:hypothetical protein
VVERLKRHRAVADVPESELSWFAERAVLRRYEPGDLVAARGTTADSGVLGLDLVLSGRIVIRRDRGTGRRKVMEWEAGEMTGVLPFSRLKVVQGDTSAERATETLSLDEDAFAREALRRPRPRAEQPGLGHSA